MLLIAMIASGSANGANTPTVRDVPDLRKTTAKPVIVIPEPQDMKFESGDFVLDKDTQIVVADSAKEEDFQGVQEFAAEVLSLYGLQLPIWHESQATGKNLILVGEASANTMLSKAAKMDGISAPNKDEGYALAVTPQRVIVMGHDKHGTYYGMQTLKQLVKSSYEALTIQGCKINDFPSMKYRGVHIYMGNSALPFHKKLIHRIIARYKMNNMVFACDQIQWKSDPDIATGFAMSQADVKEDIAYAKKHFLDVTPQISTLGHTNWIYFKGHHLDIAEDPKHPYAYCPSNQKSYDYIFKILDEAIELFDHPKYLHIGHDEVFGPNAQFPCDAECKKKTVADLFIGDTIKIHDYLKSKGVKTMMWGDMMLSPGSCIDACTMPDPKQAEQVRKSIPKDIVVTDWHYLQGKPEDYGSLKLFHAEGLQTIASPWYREKNIQNFAKAAKADGSMGLLQTTWAGRSIYEDMVASPERAAQFSAYILAAEYAWDSGKKTVDQLPYRAEDVFADQWHRMRHDKECLKGFTVGLAPLYNTKLAYAGDDLPWGGMTATNDLSSAPVGDVRLGDDFFALGKSVSENSAIRLSAILDLSASYPNDVVIPVGRKAESLLFLHTTATSSKWVGAGDIVGTYKINYASGKPEEIKLIYKENITAWDDAASCPGARTAWEGRTKAGNRVSLHELEWQNPRPQDEIESIEFHTLDTVTAPALLGISGISTK
jgi:hypothetical protein